MGGKASILMVLGFSMIFLVFGYNYNNMTNRAIDNFIEYYTNTNSHNIAVAGANMAANEVFMNKSWDTGFTNLTINGGTLNVYVSNPLSGSGKVTICHVPPGNPTAKRVLVIPASAVAGHLAHGDHLGTCGADSVDYEKITIVSEGTYNGKTDVVEVELRPSTFSKFGYFADQWGAGYLVTGDTVSGPFHTNQTLRTLGSPVFMGKVTAKGLRAEGNKWGFGEANPQFNGGIDTPVNVPFNLDISNLEKAAIYSGRVFADNINNKAQDLRLVFNSDQTVDWSVKLTNKSTWTTPVNALLDTLAPNGVIWNKAGNLYVSGVVNGKYTIGTGEADYNSYGNVYIEDDVKYREPPILFLPNGKTAINPDVKDMLGIVADKQIVIKDNAANRNNVEIDASLFNYGRGSTPINPFGGITVENISSSSPNMGALKIYGGLIEKAAQTTGYTNGAGYNELIRYDARFMTQVPPSFPTTSEYEIVSWYE